MISLRDARVAVLGCGSIGRRHLANLRNLGHRDLAMFDPRSERLLALASEFGATAFGDIGDLWAWRPEVTFVCAPTNYHVPLGIDAARLGSHLFIEKPLSHRREGLDVLKALIVEQSLAVMVACNMRFHPGPLQAKRWLDEGAIGDVLAARIQTGSFLPRWRPTDDYRLSYSASPESGGAVLDCIHEIDLALWLLGEAKLRAAATKPAKSIGLDVDGVAEIILDHANGAISSVHLNFVQRNYRRCIEIIGSQGTIEWDFANGWVNLFGPDGAIARQSQQPAEWDVNQMYIDEIECFLRHASEGTPPPNSVSEAMRTLEIAQQVRSA